MSALESKLKIVEKQTQLSEADHEHVKKAFADEQAAQAAFDKVQADAQVKAGELNMARGAFQSFTNYLIKAYEIGATESLDVETGIITRAPNTE